MFHLNNFNSSDIPYIVNKLFPSNSKESIVFPNLYQMEEPYRMQIVTLRPSEEEQHFVMSSLSPNHIIYNCLERSEAELRLTPQLHLCEFYEILIVLDGCIYQTIENERHVYKQGSCCLLNPNVRHTLEFTTEFRIVLLQFSIHFLKLILEDLSLSFFDIEQQPANNLEDFLHSDFHTKDEKTKKYIDFIPLQENEWIIENVHHLLDEMAKTTLNPAIGASHRIKSICFRLMQLLSSSDNYHTTPTQVGTETENSLYNQIVKIMERSHGRVTRSDLEKQLNYSGNYLNEIVKKYTGLNIFQYGMSFCLKEAARLLITSNKNVSEISNLLGFTNRTHFYRLFENMYHMTPKEFRKKYQNKYLS